MTFEMEKEASKYFHRLVYNMVETFDEFDMEIQYPGGILHEIVLSRTEYAESRTKCFEIYHTPLMLGMTLCRSQKDYMEIISSKK